METEIEQRVMEGTEEVRREAEDSVRKLVEKVEREAEEAARARAEEQLRQESDRIRVQAQRREERAREATEDEIKASAKQGQARGPGGRRRDGAVLAAQRVGGLDRRLPHLLGLRCQPALLTCACDARGEDQGHAQR